MSATSSTIRTISGIDAMRGAGAPQPQGFWADAWSRVLRRRGAVIALGWISLVAFLAVFSPLIANGNPIRLTMLATGEVSYPLLEHLSATDLCLILGALVGVPWLLLPIPIKRSTRLGMLIVAGMQAGCTIVLAFAIGEWFASLDRPIELRKFSREAWFPWQVAGCAAVVIGLVAAWIPTSDSLRLRCGAVLAVAVLTVTCLTQRWNVPLVDIERYSELEASGQATAIYTLIPWSPVQGRTALHLQRPGERLGVADPAFANTVPGARTFILGTDNVGRDVMSQMLHACRLSISIGLVSTSIAVLLGVTIGSFMGYFGGKIDLVLFRVVEIFMAIPVLFLLIVAAGVLPRNTYVMMIIIGCVTWTGAARFTRAEFLKLRTQDFVQSARATGLPLRSILFRHMLPNGVTPVLVDASFAIASAITFEATLSFLGLGPEGQPSWGQLLSSATGATGLFNWWLAIFPGVAIFLTVLSYNVLGEALRDAIDPKLRKAAQ